MVMRRPADLRREIDDIGRRIRQLQADDDADQADALEQEIERLRTRRKELLDELTAYHAARRYRVARFPMLRRWPRFPDDDDACHLYIGASERGLCGRTSGNATGALSEMSCPACWWRLIRKWLRIWWTS
jgi:hypothetical protein